MESSSTEVSLVSSYVVTTQEMTLTGPLEEQSLQTYRAIQYEEL